MRIETYVTISNINYEKFFGTLSRWGRKKADRILTHIAHIDFGTTVAVKNKLFYLNWAR